MNEIDKNNYLPVIQDDHVVVRRIFNYIGNYLHKHDEDDILDIDFITTIAIFLDTSLIPIHFRREEQVLFKKLNRLTISSSMQSQIKKIIKTQKFIEQLALDLSLLKIQYDKGNNSSINEIHTMLWSLLKSYNKLELEQKKLFPQIDRFLSDPQKKKLSNDLLKFDQYIIKELIHHSIIEKYRKYDNLTEK